MSQLKRVAFVGNSLPRRCGIATFTTDLHRAVSRSSLELKTGIVAMNDHCKTYDYPPEVFCQIEDGDRESYQRAAAMLNAGHYDVVSLQHEFGIFGGEAGVGVMTLLSRLKMPVVTTLHTVLAKPTPAQGSVLGQVVDASSRVVVMANKGRELLRTVYQVPGDKIEVIPHGIPEFPTTPTHETKLSLGFDNRPVILTFGLLSPNKGIEVMIDAMPQIVRSCPDAIYLVLGATHPNLVRDQGETYRENLVARVHSLGLRDHVRFLDQFVDQKTLLRFISICDVYVTPYLNEAQMTSGTLSYSFGAGKAVVSTPYWHACELLADGRGILVPFGDVTRTGGEIAALLTDPDRRAAIEARAFACSRSMVWPRIAERYAGVFEQALQKALPDRTPASKSDLSNGGNTISPPLNLAHFLSMCDDVGIFQHAIYSVADRRHGYCVDDNARALLLACALNKPGEVSLPDSTTSRFSAFIQHAWNSDAGRFRNFMSYDRRWLEPYGSEDSHGRTLWALGECTRADQPEPRRRWATALFRESFAAVEHFGSPRACAFTLLGLNACCASMVDDAPMRKMQVILANRLTALLAANEDADWVWFEDNLSYDNARLSQALIETAHSTATERYEIAGMRSLRWLVKVQTTPNAIFRPVGSQSFGARRAPPLPFDQQPLEAAATISACLAAWRATGAGPWRMAAERAFAWFHGENDLSIPMVDPETGSCRDGLHPDRANANCGGESVLSYLLGLAEIRQLRWALARRKNTLPQLALSA